MKAGDRVLITGVTGFIGGRLAQRLVTEEGVQVRGLARTPDKGAWLAELGVEIVPGDITDLATVRAAAQGCQIIYHAAAWVSESGRREEVWRVNVDGTQNVAEAALAIGAERLIHVSSCAVYGSLQQFDIAETTPMRRSGNLYADSKATAEEGIWQARAARGLPVVVARPSQVYGPGSTQFTIRPVEAIRNGKMILIDGGRHLCKPIYIDNLVDGLILCARLGAALGEAFNFSEGTVTWRDFFGAYARMLGVESLPSLPYALAWLAAGFYELLAAVKGKKASLNRRVVNSLRSKNSFSNHKARTVLGWAPKVDLTEGMQRTEAWLRAAGYLDRP